MEENYPVRFGNQSVGKVTVRKQGLYYQIRCRCQISGDVVCRLVASCGDKQEKLGVLAPIQDGFGLDTNLPVKRLGTGTPIFSLLPKHDIGNAMFVPIYPEEPFAYIARLKDGFLTRKNGQLGMMIE